MATLTPTFRMDSARIHKEHESFEQLLQGLDKALDFLVCYAEVYADLATAGQVHRYGRQLAEQFAEHCQREEDAVLEPISQVSPELREFCNQMKAEHCALRMQSRNFLAALDDFEVDARDLHDTVYRLKEIGRQFIGALRQHVATEENELRGFL